MMLEQIPPRLLLLENEVAGVKSELHLARNDINQISATGHTNNRLLGGLEGKIERLFWTGAGVFITCSALGALAALAISAVKTGVFE